MSTTYYLAVDIGASSGRHIIGYRENGKLVYEEVYRFANGMKDVDGRLVWDTEMLFNEIVAGIRKCGEIGKAPSYMGIDTWGVDYVFLDAEDRVVGRTYGYRDSRTDGMDEEVYKIIPEQELYSRTGIQKAILNTIFQLMAVRQQEPELFERAETMLMMPDYFNFLLTGVKRFEYTNASTTGLLNPDAKDWDRELIDRLGFPQKIFGGLTRPGSVVGRLRPEIREKVGYDLTVLLPCTHDTGSAVAAVPTDSDSTIYISSGTWSLMGTEIFHSNCSEEAWKANLTNEGGMDYRFRFLKNIMGLWMIQSVKREFEKDWSFADLCAEAAKQDIRSIVNCDDQRFFAPKSMIGAIKDACAETGQQVPETDAEIASVIYNSLAECYRQTIEQVKGITGVDYDHINIVGGGSNADYLNEVTARRTGLTVIAGPGEATAIGNIIVQMIYTGDYANLKEARKSVAESFEVKYFKP